MHGVRKSSILNVCNYYNVLYGMGSEALTISKTVPARLQRRGFEKDDKNLMDRKKTNAEHLRYSDRWKKTNYGCFRRACT